jgi:hypothetical protein
MKKNTKKIIFAAGLDKVGLIEAQGFNSGFNPGLYTQIEAPRHTWLRAGMEDSLGDRLEAYPTLRSGVSSAEARAA